MDCASRSPPRCLVHDLGGESLMRSGLYLWEFVPSVTHCTTSIGMFLIQIEIQGVCGYFRFFFFFGQERNMKSTRHRYLCYITVKHLQFTFLRRLFSDFRGTFSTRTQVSTSLFLDLIITFYLQQWAAQGPIKINLITIKVLHDVRALRGKYLYNSVVL